MAADAKAIKAVESLGGELIEFGSGVQPTHVVAFSAAVPLKNTAKLMLALCYGSAVVSNEWLLASAKAGTLLDHTSTASYSNTEINAVVERARQRAAGVLNGYTVHIVPNTEGAPPPDLAQPLIEAAGGTWLQQLRSTGKRSAAEAAALADSEHLLVIASADATGTAAKVAQLGKDKHGWSWSLLREALLHQQDLDFTAQ